MRRRHRVTLLVLLNVIGVGTFASGLSLASISLHDRSQTTAPSSWIRTTGAVCGVTKSPTARPRLVQAKVCYQIKTHRYFVMDLTTQLKVVLGAKRTVAYDPKNPWNARDISQVKPNWMTLLKEGILLALAGVLVLIYSLRRVIDVRGGTSREEFGHLSTTTSKGQ